VISMGGKSQNCAELNKHGPFPEEADHESCWDMLAVQDPAHSEQNTNTSKESRKWGFLQYGQENGCTIARSAWIVIPEEKEKKNTLTNFTSQHLDTFTSVVLNSSSRSSSSCFRLYEA